MCSSLAAAFRVGGICASQERFCHFQTGWLRRWLLESQAFSLLPPCRCPLVFGKATQGLSSERLLGCQSSIRIPPANPSSPSQAGQPVCVSPSSLDSFQGALIHPTSTVPAQLPSCSSPFELHTSSLPNALSGQITSVCDREGRVFSAGSI